MWRWRDPLIDIIFGDLNFAGVTGLDARNADSDGSVICGLL